MIKVNGTDFPLYLMDNDKSVKERIATEFSSLPKYLYFETDLNLDPDHNNKVIDILTKIKDYKDTVNFDELYKKVLPLMNQKLNMKHDIFDVWLAYNTEIPKEIASQGDNFPLIYYDQIEKIQQIFNDKDINKEYFKNFSRIDATRIKTSLESKINTLKSSVDEHVKLFKQFELIEGGVLTTDFEIESASFNIILDMYTTSLMEMFNKLTLNSTIPFASFNNYFKVLKDFTPIPGWGQSTDDIVMLRVLQRRAPKQIIDEDYAYAFIQNKDDKMVLNININPSKSNIRKEEYIQRIFNVVGDIPTKSETEDNVRGLFYIPGQGLNKYVLSDLIMNNEMFSNFLVIDEHEKMTKKRSELIIKFKDKKDGLITANITQKFREKSDEISNKPYNTFPMGGKYLRVHVSTSRNMKVVNNFRNILSKLFKIYNEEYPKIVKIYKQYIPTFASKDKDTRPMTKKSKQRFKDVAPKDLYNPAGKKIRFDCNNKPRIVSKEEAEEIERSGKGDYMIFPKDTEYTNKQYLVCTEHKKHLYPGLKLNPFPSKDKLGYLPCCFIDDQKTKKDSYYRKYYDNIDEIDIEKTKGRGKDLIITKKFVNIKQPGILPENISKFFENIDPTGTYYRVGMSRTRNSFLECVLDALNIEEFSNEGRLNISDRKNITSRQRQKLVKLSGTGICRQEFYDSTTEEIQKMVRDENIYLDPKLFIRLLETYYNCNIFIFTRDHGNEGGKMVLPRFSQSYLKNENTDPCIFIFEHMGATSNMAEYPQCELIIKNVDNKQSFYSFLGNDLVSIRTKKMFNKIRIAYKDNKVIKETIFPRHDSLKFISQVIDPSGKCRMLYSTFKNKKLSLIVDPIPPLEIPEVRNINVQKIDYTLAKLLIDEIGMVLIEQTVIKGMSKELRCEYGNVIVTIPINDREPIQTIKISDKMALNIENVSVLDSFNYSKKITRYIVEYILWLFSKYLHSNSINIINEQVLTEFIDKHVAVNPEFRYGDVPKKFSMNSSLMEGGKLIIRSEEALKRLIYVLRLESVRQRKKIINYYSHDMIDNYYMDITDFDHYPFQIILYGDESIDRFIKEKYTKQFIVHNKVIPSLTTPYFFKNKLISNKIFLAQNTRTMPEAFNIVSSWHKFKYNTGYLNNPEEPLKGTLYSYKNSNDISEFIIDGKENNYNMKIIGYKYMENDVIMTGFTVLLRV